MNTRLPSGFSWCAPTVADAKAIVDLICLIDVFDYGEPDYSIEDLRAEWRRDEFQLDRDAWMIYASDGTLAGYGNVYDTGEHIRVEPTTCVHPQFRERGLEDFHIAQVETRACQAAETHVVQWIVNIEHRSWTERFLQRGYQTTRHDYVMEIALDAPPTPPILPDRFVMRSYERGRDEQAVWATLQESFRDHRGHSDLSYEEWAPAYFEHADWSPELSVVVTENEEVVAAAMVFGYPNGGWVRSLGVRRPWRKQGIGLAMLYRIFEGCYKKGLNKVGLGVDAESLTGATRLYERAGMKVKVHFVRYEKEIV